MATVPPFEIPSSITGPWVAVPIQDHSDGDERNWPGRPDYRPSTETNYLIKLATSWMQSRGEYQPGVNYFLDKLPRGYSLFETTDGHAYKRLWGHPSGKFFDSIVRFFEHFKWLQGGLQGTCDCVLDSKKRAAPVRRTGITLPGPTIIKRIPLKPEISGEVSSDQDSSAQRSRSTTGLATLREKRLPRVIKNRHAVDEEGTRDIYKYWIKDSSLHPELLYDDPILELDSIDWKAERKSLETYHTQISLQHSFIPRIGELVLWCPYFPEKLDLVFNPENEYYQFYSVEQQAFLGFPSWRGGLVTEVPASSTGDGSTDFPDILSNPSKRSACNMSGFRIEAFPDPNNDADKSLSKQYRYVTMRHIRPLSHWQILLRGIPEKKLDPTIKYAITCMTTISLVEKFMFRAVWPLARVHCKGVYLGPELLIVGDAVRLLPDGAASPRQLKDNSTTTPRCTDVLVISSIRLLLDDIKPEHVLPESNNISTRSAIRLIGSAYTLDFHRDYRLQNPNLDTTSNAAPQPVALEDVKSIFPAVGAKEYGDWYPLHAPHQKYEISFDRVLGRMHEAGALRLWLGMLQNSTKDPTSAPKLTLDYDLPAVLAGRHYGTATDERIPSVPKGTISWFWADTRVQALNVKTVNGYEVGAYDDIRNKQTLRAWRATLKVLDGTGSVDDIRTAGLPGQKGRKQGAKLVDGRIVYPADATTVAQRRTSSVGLGSQGNVLKGPSAMVEAALEDGSDDDDDEEEEEEEEEEEGDENGDEGEDMDDHARPDDEEGDAASDTTSAARRLAKWTGPPSGPPSRPASATHHHPAAATPTAKKRKAPRTKTQIMQSVEGDELESDDYDDNHQDHHQHDDNDNDNANDDDDDLLGPPPLARGGTEEDSLGDYHESLE